MLAGRERGVRYLGRDDHGGDVRGTGGALGNEVAAYGEGSGSDEDSDDVSIGEGVDDVDARVDALLREAELRVELEAKLQADEAMLKWQGVPPRAVDTWVDMDGQVDARKFLPARGDGGE